MPNISVRNIDDETMAQLRVQAAKHGVSMEEEVRRILKRSVASPERLGDLAVRLFSPAYTGEGDFKLPSRETHDPIEF
jgi:antitoxin FitA